MATIKKVDGHSELLEDALHQLVRYGTLVVEDFKLMRWTETKRVTHSMWSYINELFNVVIKEIGEHKHGYKLYVGEGNDTYTFIIWDRGEGEMVKDPWWIPIEELSQPKKRLRAGRVGEVELESAES